MLCNFITISKNLLEINLSGADLNAEYAKEIADGIMRAKQLQSIDLSNNNKITNTGLSAIIYNLAFSPKLQFLNISNC